MALAAEEWRPVLGGDYEVSSLGGVRRARPGRRTSVGRPMKPVLMRIGYLMVAPTVNGRNRRMYVHRLVAEAFLGPCPDGCEVNHIDGCKTNNTVENLEYVTHAENMRHAVNVGLSRSGAACPNAKLTEETVRELRARRAEGASFGVLAREFGVGIATAFNAAKGNSWRSL